MYVVIDSGMHLPFTSVDADRHNVVGSLRRSAVRCESDVDIRTRRT